MLKIILCHQINRTDSCLISLPYKSQNEKWDWNELKQIPLSGNHVWEVSTKTENVLIKAILDSLNQETSIMGLDHCCIYANELPDSIVPAILNLFQNERNLSVSGVKTLIDWYVNELNDFETHFSPTDIEQCLAQNENLNSVEIKAITDWYIKKISQKPVSYEEIMMYIKQIQKGNGS